MHPLIRVICRSIRRAVFRRLDERLDANAVLLGRLHARQIREVQRIEELRDVEFGVFSSGGEDGIIQYLVQRLQIENNVFVEFGVENYRESNTRFLMTNNNWSGLVIDRDAGHIRSIKEEGLYRRHDLTVICAHITRDNINALIADNGVQGDIGLLSVDIDGCDYWVWEAITCVQPRIVVCEYNSVFGNTSPISVPYDPMFDRFKQHSSGLYFGASLPALRYLGKKKGYVFVGSNSMGSNAFFVSNDFVADADFPCPGESEGYVDSRFRESRDTQGRLTFKSGPARRGLIAQTEIVNVVTGSRSRLGDEDDDVAS